MSKDIDIREKFGDWFLDIAKYVATVMILSVSFSNVEQPTFVWIAAIILFLALILAFVLYKPRNKNNKRNNNIKKNRR